MELSKKDKVLFLLVAVFITLMVISNVIAVKTISLWGCIGPAAVICYSLSYLVTDTLSEIFGKKTTQFVVNLGFISVLISVFFVKLAIASPGSPFWDKQEAYEIILGSNFRLSCASLAAYLCSQTHDVWSFHFWKKRTQGKHLWLRNNVSSICSQLIDTLVFIFIAFAGTGIPLLPMIVGQYIIKVVIALLDTPFVYLTVMGIRKYLNLEDDNKENISSKKVINSCS